MKWEPAVKVALDAVLGFKKDFDQKEFAKTLAEVKKIAIELDKHMKHQE